MNHFQKQDLPVIQQYLAQKLGEKAKAAFDRRIEAEPALQQELLQYHAFFSALEVGEDRRLKTLLQNTSSEDWKTIKTDLITTPPVQRHIKRFYWGVAATLLLLVGFFSWRYFNGLKPAYFEPATLAAEDFSGEFNRMRSAKQIIVPENQPNYRVEYIIVEKYNSGGYQAALDELEKLPASAVTLFYSAKCLLALHREREAITLLKKVETYTEETYSNTAQWLLAVAYFQLGDKELAKEYAERATKNEGIEDRDRGLAREMLKDLK